MENKIKLIAKEDYIEKVWGERPKKVLTGGATYELTVISSGSNYFYYEGIDDGGYKHSFHVNRFYTLEETRQIKLNELGI